MSNLLLTVGLEPQFYAAIASLKASIDVLSANVKAGFKLLELQMVTQADALQHLTDNVTKLTGSVSAAAAELKTLADQLVAASGSAPQVEALAQNIDTLATSLQSAADAAAAEVAPPPVTP